MTPAKWEQVSELFHRGLPLTPREREELLNIHVDDVEMEAQLRQLWQHAEPTGFLEHPSLRLFQNIASEWDISSRNQGAALAREASSSEEQRDEIGRYRIVSVLGEGGMGTVYLAVQDKPVQRQVAIKVIRFGMRGVGALARFESERQALAILDHANIAQMYEADVGVDGRPYFVMEYVQGRPITEHCDTERLTCRERLVLFQQVCQAVQHAHQRGIIHRDLKPSNILVAIRDGKPVPKVIDFGVAKAFHQGIRLDRAYTEPGMMVGTPEYMSPEQAEYAADVDTTSDVYSLGVILYELLAGTLPFDSRSLRRGGLSGIRRAIRKEAPLCLTQRLSTFADSAGVACKRRSDLPQLLKQLNGDWNWIVMKAIEKERTRRYRSAADLAADIERSLTNRPVFASPPSKVYELKKFARRHCWEVATAATFLAVIVAGLVTSTSLYIRGERARVVAEHQAYKASLAAARSSLDGYRGAEARETLLTVPGRLRSWEWNYLYWMTDTSVATVNSGEGGADNHVAFSPDGRAVFVSTATSVHRWKTGSFERAGDYGPFERIVSLSTDGSKVVSAVKEGSLSGFEVLDVESRRSVFRSPSRDSPLADAAFDVMGRRLATLTNGGRAEVWDLLTHRLLSSIVPPEPVPARGSGKRHEMIALSPDGEMVATTGYNGIGLYQAVTGRRVAELREGNAPVQSISFSADGQRLLSASTSAKVWEVKTGKLLSSSNLQKSFSNLAESPDGRTLALAVFNHAVDFVSRTSGEILETVLTPTVQTIAALAWSSRGEYLVGVDYAGGVHVWRGPSMGGQLLAVFDREGASSHDASRREAGFNSMVLSADGQRMAVAAGSELRLIDTETSQQISALPTAEMAPIPVLAWQAGTEVLAFVSNRTDIVLCTTASATPVRRLVGHGAAVTALVFSPDGQSLLSGSEDRTVRSWNLKTGAQRVLIRLPGKVNTLTISPSGQTMAIEQDADSYASGEPFLQLVQTETGELLPRLEQMEEYRGSRLTYAMAFSPDGRWVTASDNGVRGAALWEVESGKLVRRLASVGKQGYAADAFAFSPDGQRLAGAFGGLLAIWDPRTGELLLELLRGAKQLSFSPDGSRLYANSVETLEAYETRSAYPSEVEEWLTALQERFPLVCDLRSNLLRTGGDSAVRTLALRRIDHRQEMPPVVQRLVDSVVDGNSGSRAAYQEALERSRALQETYPWDQKAGVRLGAALYRTGDYRRALDALNRARPAEPEAILRKQAFTAMLYFRLGDAGRAEGSLQEARRTAADLRSSGNFRISVDTLLQEADLLIRWNQ